MGGGRRVTAGSVFCFFGVLGFFSFLGSFGSVEEKEKRIKGS